MSAALPNIASANFVMILEWRELSAVPSEAAILAWDNGQSA
jgi:hypothetical protein